MNQRPAKVLKIIEKVRVAVAVRSFRVSGHARKRMVRLGISSSEMVFILKNGYHETRKDEFMAEFNDWNYAIRGKTVDARSIRLAVALELHGFVVVTAIDLDKEDKE